LLVHRVLESYLQKRTDSASDISAGPNLTEVGKHITFTEQRADGAEKELKTVLLLQMLSKKIGQELDCVVTGLTSFGLFVQCQTFGIEGLIRMADLGQDYWKYNERLQSIVGENSGCNIRLGQGIKVRIVSVNVPARQLNVAPAELLTGPAKKTKKKRKTKTRKKKPRKRPKR
jgi:ribonuclease R